MLCLYNGFRLSSAQQICFKIAMAGKTTPNRVKFKLKFVIHLPDRQTALTCAASRQDDVEVVVGGIAMVEADGDHRRVQADDAGVTTGTPDLQLKDNK